MSKHRNDDDYVRELEDENDRLRKLLPGDDKYHTALVMENRRLWVEIERLEAIINDIDEQNSHYGEYDV